MKTQVRPRHRRLRRRRLALKVALLMLPALFWSGVFAALAGVRPLGRVFERAPDAAQLFVAAACLLFALVLGLEAAGQNEARASSRPGPRRFEVAAGVALFFFAVLAALRPA